MYGVVWRRCGPDSGWLKCKILLKLLSASLSGRLGSTIMKSCFFGFRQNVIMARFSGNDLGAAAFLGHDWWLWLAAHIGRLSMQELEARTIRLDLTPASSLLNSIQFYLVSSDEPINLSSPQLITYALFLLTTISICLTLNYLCDHLPLKFLHVKSTCKRYAFQRAFQSSNFHHVFDYQASQRRHNLSPHLLS